VKRSGDVGISAAALGLRQPVGIPKQSLDEPVLGRVQEIGGFQLFVIGLTFRERKLDAARGKIHAAPSLAAVDASKGDLEAMKGPQATIGDPAADVSYERRAAEDQRDGDEKREVHADA
jgi:hypothetical protein